MKLFLTLFLVIALALPAAAPAASINQLSASDSVSAGDLLPVWITSNSDTRKVSLSVLLTYINAHLTPVGDGKVTQYSAPALTALTTTIAPADGTSVWLVLTPTAGFAAHTIVLPPVASCKDLQEILVNCTQSVTTLTITANGSNVVGAPTTLAANAFFRLRHDALTHTWYRVG